MIKWLSQSNLYHPDYLTYDIIIKVKLMKKLKINLILLTKLNNKRNMKIIFKWLQGIKINLIKHSGNHLFKFQ